MIKLYSKEMQYIKSFSPVGLRITQELETGYKTAQFHLPYSFGVVLEEQKVEIDEYLYVIKEVNIGNKDCYEIFCKPYFGSLQKKRVDNYNGYGITFDDAMSYLLMETDWTYEGTNIAGSYTIDITNKTLLEALRYISSVYNVYFEYKTKERVIAAASKNLETGISTTYTITAANISNCVIQSNTYDLVTRLIPIGKNLTTIQLVNNNCLWLEDFSYTKDVIVGYFFQNSIDNADDLRKTAFNKLQLLCRPRETYKIPLSQLSKKITIGDSIRIVNTLKESLSVLKVQKVVLFPYEQESSYIELGDPPVSFDNIYKDFTSAQSMINQSNLKSLAELNKL